MVQPGVVASGFAPAGRTPLWWAARVGWAALWLFYAAFAGVEVWNHGVLALVATVAFFVAPDLAMAIDAKNGGHGSLGPRAVPFYNAAHRTAVPLALAVAYSVSPLDAPALFAGLLGWLGHIAMDRTFGYGLRATDGSRRG
ncbi:DUF4260 family protein [Actinomadura logoneensis]|uniref:DUF4260 family protein n=1 Tax=Actinomadura logoneensis TaxID=2293572 RepID=A0A372JPT9_9ACTN|nr:DUF4260 family protein [Actinomadura logoneensis]RFU41980.1 DUF4260 family protein [Actinomadura logoneensis]